MALTTQAAVETDAPETLQTTTTPSSMAGAEGANSIQNAMSQAAQPQQAVTNGNVTANNNANSAYNYQTVDQAYNNLVDTNSPMMQQAAATAQREAARRGLGNSSMAVGSAQGAVANTAATMASQMAQQSQNQSQFNRGTDVQESQYDRSQTEQERAQQKAEEFTGRQMTEAERAALVGESQNQQQINNQNQQFQQSLSQQQQEFNRNMELENRKISEQAKQFSNSIQANARGAYTDSVNNLLNNSSVNINNISSNANISQADKNALIQQELNNRNNDLQYLQSLYGNVTSWSDRL